VRTIALQHGGSVRAVSEGLGKGTTMLLKLPLSIGEANS
jgi:two-component system sensor histidine kinase SenX3